MMTTKHIEVNMGTFLIIASLLTHQLEVIVVKSYGDKNKPGGSFFNAIICFFSMLFFIITDKGGFYFPAPLFIYGVISCLGYAAGFYFTYLAFKCGSYANTKLLSSVGTVLTVLYGTIFLKEESNAVTWLAVVLILLSAALMNMRKKGDDNYPFNIKWFIYVMLSVLGNFVITVVKREQQLRFDGKCDNEFLILSLLGAFLFLFAHGLVNDKNALRPALKSGTLFGALAGMFNGATNLLSIITLLYVPISIVSPIKSGGALLLSFVVSRVIYKEKFTARQLVSAFIGVFALVLFKLA